MVALHTAWYDVVKVHGKLRMSPAMAAGVTDTLWSVEGVVKPLEAADPTTARRGPHKKRKA